MDQLAREFNSMSESSVLLINGERVATGINLQGMTDLIFLHSISHRHNMGKSVMGQIIGRAIRIGRRYKLRVHHLLYPNENI